MKTNSSSFSLMTKKTSCLFLFLFTTSCALPQGTLRQKLFSFKTDQCTLFPERSLADPNQDWSHCCVAHDISYWIGGPESWREKADDKLKSCVKETGAIEEGELMHTGVAVGGAPYFQTPWAWGFGWRRKKSYSSFDSKQISIIQQKIPSVLDVLKNLQDQWSSQQYDYVREYLDKIRGDLKS